MTNGNKVLDRIDEDELTELAVDLGNIYGPRNHEGPVAEFLTDWLEENGFTSKLIPEDGSRPSVVAKIEGNGSGSSLAFNSHMDAIMSKDDHLSFTNPKKKVYHNAWVEDGKVWGFPVVNDRGPMACFLIAAKAIQESGIELDGDLILTMVPGEIEGQPDVGTEQIVRRGVVPDYAIVAEATNFKLGKIEAGIAYYKVTVTSDRSRYGPYIDYPERLEDAPNAIVKATPFLKKLVDWARQYPEEHGREYSSGKVEPKVNIGAIRGGELDLIFRGPQVCNIHLDVYLTPDGDPREIQKEIEEVAVDANVEADVDLYHYRKGFEAKNTETIEEAVSDAHQTIFDSKPQRPDTTENSMWRDLNAFNQMGVTAINYGPGGGAGAGTEYFTIEDMVNASKVYALTALNTCRGG